MPVLIWIASLIELIRVSPINLSFLIALQVVNGLVLYLQDKKSRSAVETIKKSLAPHALVKRDLLWKRVRVNELVPGDRIQIGPGDLLPADCILGPGECSVDQSMLTGETKQVLKIEGNKLYMGSLCKKGEVEANVYATGTNTFFGKSNLFSSEVNQKGNIEKVLGRVAFLLMIISGILVTIILIIFLYKGNEFLESLSSSVVMLVLSLPIAMQAVCASTLAVGANRLNKKKTVVSRLASIEELASMEILCIHKTFMLTKGEPVVNGHFLISSESISHLFQAAYLSSRRDIKNPIDKCLCEYAVNDLKLSFEDFEEEDYCQYDPKIKRSEVAVRNIMTGEMFKFCKGAPQVILALTESWDLEDEVTSQVVKFASQGYSVIAVAASGHSGKWDFLGLISIFDPFFEGVSEDIKALRDFNVKILFLTGDQMAISKQISNDIGLGDLIFNAEVFNNDMTTVQRELLDSILMQADGFAEVYPEHKFTIVKLLQKKEKKVGITGVSINDAPALKRADVGLAGFEATDAAKSSADIIFEEPGLHILYQATVKARRIFRRAKTYCIYRISCSCQLLIFFFISLAAINPKKDFRCRGSNCDDVPNTSAFPVIAMVIIALLNDITIISISSDRASPSQAPCKWNMIKIYIISCTLGAVSFFSSFAFLLVALSHMDSHKPNIIFDYFRIPAYSYGQVLTAVFLKLSISNYLTIFSVRSSTWFFCSRPGIELGITSLTALSTTTIICKYWVLNIQPKNSVVVASMHSIDWNTILIVWTFCFIIFIVQDLLKMCIHISYSRITFNLSDWTINRMCLVESMKQYHLNYSKGILTQRSNLAAG
jgi:H+-transporting ATPase